MPFDANAVLFFSPICMPARSDRQFSHVSVPVRDLRQCVTNCVVYHRICIEEPTHNHSEPSFWLRRSTSFAEPGAPGNVSPQDYIGALQCMSCVLSNAGNDISAVWTYPIVW